MKSPGQVQIKVEAGGLSRLISKFKTIQELYTKATLSKLREFLNSCDVDLNAMRCMALLEENASQPLISKGGITRPLFRG
jgi:hypothetical protein